jgi:F-type H+-transporting ATPase subunit a
VDLHPYLFFSKLFEVMGFDHFAHNYHVIYTWVVMIVLFVLAWLATRSVTLIPGKAQNFLEVLLSGMEEFMVEVAGEESRWFFPIIATIFIYVLVCNLFGMIPGFFPPTADLNTTASCAIPVFIFTHYIGVKYHGAKYYKHFMGPIWWLAPLIVVIEVIGHFARILSLSFRLFGNMAGHEIVLAILFGLAGLFLAPLPLMALGIFVSVVQAFVFFLLSIIYFSGAMEHAH